MMLFITVYCSKVASTNNNVTQDHSMEMTIRSIVAFYSFLLALVLMRSGDFLTKLGPDRMKDLLNEEKEYDIKHFVPPSPYFIESFMAPFKLLLKTEISGLERVVASTENPHLFIMNHSLYGLEMPLFLYSLLKNKNIMVRGLADNFHFSNPVGSFLRKVGAVDASRENVDICMTSRQNLLLYPGGGHEVMKPASIPRYSLMWKNRLGFARLAIKHGYPIQPCAAVGTEDMLQTLYDIPASFFRKDQFIPVVILPPMALQKVYFWFGEPISTKEYNGEWNNVEYAIEVRDKTKKSIEAGIQELLQKQKSDPDRYLCDRAAATVKAASKEGLRAFCEKLSLVKKDITPTLDDDNDSTVEEEKKSK